MTINKTIFTLFLAGAITFLTGCGGDDGDDGATGDTGATGAAGAAGADAASSTISLSFLGRYETNEFDESAAEIVAYDAATEQAFVVNANSGLIDIIDISSPATPTLVDSLALGTDIAAAVTAVASADDLGAANSVTVSGDTVAVAVEAATKQDNGYVAFYSTAGTFLSAVEVGALPDMVTYTPDGSKVVVANEGEPSDDYTNDPEGTVSVIDVSGGEASVTAANVTSISFSDFNTGGARASELSSDVRISQRSASVAQDLEPEYIAVSADSMTAWVAMQENNSLAIIDLSDNSIDTILGLGYKDHQILGNELDASNSDGSINIRDWPLRGLFMPDSIDAYEYAGTTYVVTANEGDSREYDDYADEIRLADIVDPDEANATINLANLSRYADNVATLAEDANLGRIKIVTDMGVSGCTVNTIATTGQPSVGCVYENLYSFGARSFTIWNGETGELVFDSGNDFELITAQRLGYDGFNATNDENEGDARSDDKGPEPEAVEIASINGKTYAFIGLERVSAIMVYDITNPEAAHFVQFVSTRDHTVDIDDLSDPSGSTSGDFSAAGDLGPESIVFVSADDSPNGEPLILVGNEVSGTTAIFQVNEVITTASE